MSREHRLELPDAAATERLGAKLSSLLPDDAVVYLRGDLGAGKTTLVRGLLRARGYTGPVRSPTFTLLEPYELAGQRILHCDLYRLAHPAELDFLGLEELAEGALLLIEWPERGLGALPPADLDVELAPLGTGRCCRLQARGFLSEQRLSALPSHNNHA